MSKSKVSLEVDDAIVLLIGTGIESLPWKPEIEGITRLEKLIFLLGEETHSMDWLKEESQFEPAPFGPFSSKLYQTVDTLLSAGIIKDRRIVDNSNIDSWEEENLIGIEENAYLKRNFSLTLRGEEYYLLLTRELDENIVSEIARFKNLFAYLPIRQLVRYIYSQYPEYTVKA